MTASPHSAAATSSLSFVFASCMFTCIARVLANMSDSCEIAQ